MLVLERVRQLVRERHVVDAGAAHEREPPAPRVVVAGDLLAEDRGGDPPIVAIRRAGTTRWLPDPGDPPPPSSSAPAPSTTTSASTTSSGMRSLMRGARRDTGESGGGCVIGYSH